MTINRQINNRDYDFQFVAQTINRLDDYERRRLIVMQIIAITIIIVYHNRHDYELYD
jgi:hypothetical protein